ncbi:hypothetical protein S7711_05329 [Stachybotrys chartarum IBT 7711]|uniref:Histidine kinase group protein n=1 Tax=Stachybotrys chartarum (strain CBS 109288 / IBT 7711) TaxID=1280523 RepID=A0A084ALI1_STACB|nr:hypothetical protein S7711_05329 [Stachybotrys chartarum IBT 7711]
MAKKKSAKQLPATDDGEVVAPANGSSQHSPSPLASKKLPKPSAGPNAPPSPSNLVICRNKHWRYISCFHGPWLQMPVEILETVANINWNTPRPRPIDPAVFFDLVKVRRLVDEASNLAVRAASDIASPTLTNVNSLGGPSMNALGLGGPGHGAKLSRERKFRMREQASQKLSHAYRLDEIACSVATMQGASPLEEVGALVLQRNNADPDALYVHFFHQKIPSRKLAESTSLQPLNDIISERPNQPELFRTRATVKTFKGDYDGALADLTHALSACRFQTSHKSDQEETDPQVQEQVRVRRRPQNVILADKDQPSSLEGQLYFQRASTYLVMACISIAEGLPAGPVLEDFGLNHHTANLSPENELLEKQAEVRKMVKLLARRAIRDYITFFSRFEYSPNLPLRYVKEFNDRVSFAAHGPRQRHASEMPSPVEPHTIYSVSDLFAAVPPPNLPPYPSNEVSKTDDDTSPDFEKGTTEWITYHPLLTDALHSLLLCHALAQTSTKELQRHAYMVARLIRLTDGFPAFQASRSAARTDWVDIVRRSKNWIQLESSWDALCAPCPLPLYDTKALASKTGPSLGRAASAAAALINGQSSENALGAEDRRKNRARQQAIVDALNDDRVVDEASFRASVVAREKLGNETAAADTAAKAAPDTATAAAPDASSQVVPNVPRVLGRANPNGDALALRRIAPEDCGSFPIMTERAMAISEWVNLAPAVPSVAKRKRRPKKAGDAKVAQTTEAMGKLELTRADED